MNCIFTHVIVQNEFEYTRYKVLCDHIYKGTKKRYLELEDMKTLAHKEIQLFYCVGKQRVLISENVLCNVDYSTRYIHAKRIGENMILVDYKEF